MEIDFEQIPLVRNEVTRQFELLVEGKKSYLEFEVREGKMFLTGSEITEKHKELGAGDALVLKTYQYLEENNMPLVPMCKIAKEYIRRFPEWRRILAKGIQVDDRTRF